MVIHIRIAKKLSKRTLSLGLAVVIIIVAIFVVAIVIKHAHEKKYSLIPSTKTNQSTTIPSKGKQASGSGPNTSGSTNPGTTKYSPPPASSNGTLIAPSGTFVSNHSPSLSGSNQQLSEQSVCNTTPGASCYVKFVNGSTAKTLQVQTTDASGATYWSWNIKDSGFTAGTWKVTAIATLNGQTESANSAIDLVVRP